jgi:hypothetical protein
VFICQFEAIAFEKKETKIGQKSTVYFCSIDQLSDDVCSSAWGFLANRIQFQARIVITVTDMKPNAVKYPGVDAASALADEFCSRNALAASEKTVSTLVAVLEGETAGPGTRIPSSMGGEGTPVVSPASGEVVPVEVPGRRLSRS